MVYLLRGPLELNQRNHHWNENKKTGNLEYRSQEQSPNWTDYRLEIVRDRISHPYRLGQESSSRQIKFAEMPRPQVPGPCSYAVFFVSN